MRCDISQGHCDTRPQRHIWAPAIMLDMNDGAGTEQYEVEAKFLKSRLNAGTEARAHDFVLQDPRFQKPDRNTKKRILELLRLDGGTWSARSFDLVMLTSGITERLDVDNVDKYIDRITSVEVKSTRSKAVKDVRRLVPLTPILSKTAMTPTLIPTSSRVPGLFSEQLLRHPSARNVSASFSPPAVWEVTVSMNTIRAWSRIAIPTSAVAPAGVSMGLMSGCR
jgi:hypothetical protein